MDLERIKARLLGDPFSSTEEDFVELLQDYLGDINVVSIQSNGEQLYIEAREKISTQFSPLSTKLAKYRFRVHEINENRIWIISDKEINRERD